jgi:hypothetical protein
MKNRHLSTTILFALTFLYIQGITPAHASTDGDLRSCLDACKHKKHDRLTDSDNPYKNLSTCWKKCEATYKN